VGLLFIKTVPPPPPSSGQSCLLRARARLVLLRSSAGSPANRRPAPLVVAALRQSGGNKKWRPLLDVLGNRFLDTWDKGGPHGAYPLPLSEKGFSLLLLQTPLISGIPHLPVWLPPQVASMPPQEEAPTSKVLLLLLHGRARPGGRNYLFFFLLFFFACFLASTSCSLKLHFSAGAFFLLSSWARSCSLTAGATLRARSCSLTAGALLRAMSGCCTAIRSSSSCSAAA
jgi:hypothetical protein